MLTNESLGKPWTFHRTSKVRIRSLHHDLTTTGLLALGNEKMRNTWRIGTQIAASIPMKVNRGQWIFVKGFWEGAILATAGIQEYHISRNTHSSMIISSSEICRAFDSVSKLLFLSGWVGLGVLEDVVSGYKWWTNTHGNRKVVRAYGLSSMRGF